MTTATTTTTTTIPGQPDVGAVPEWRYAVTDALSIAWRNLLAYVRLPQLLVFSTIQPTIFVLMFRYVFGGSMALVVAQRLPGVDYVDFLMPGIFVQTAVFGAMGTAIGLAQDLDKGMIERFRSLPIARSAVLMGRTLADSVRNVFVVVLMTVVGFMVGFRPDGNVAKYLLAMALVVLFGFSLSWIMAAIGLSVPNAETAQAAVFPLIAPMIFASSAFTPTETMPGWLQVFANHQPVTITIDAVRRLILDQPVEQYVWGSLLWSFALVAVFAPFAVRQYRRVR